MDSDGEDGDSIPEDDFEDYSEGDDEDDDEEEEDDQDEESAQQPAAQVQQQPLAPQSAAQRPTAAVPVTAPTPAPAERAAPAPLAAPAASVASASATIAADAPPGGGSGGAGAAGATEEAEDSLGMYRIVSAGPLKELPVSQAAARSSTAIAQLPLQTEVEVVEIAAELDGGRRRARIRSPAGWITLVSTAGHCTRFAERLPPASSPPAEQATSGAEPAAAASPEATSGAEPAAVPPAAMEASDALLAPPLAEASPKPLADEAPAPRRPTKRGAGLLLQGLRNGEVGRIIDQAEAEAVATSAEPEPAPAPVSTRKEETGGWPADVAATDVETTAVPLGHGGMASANGLAALAAELDRPQDLKAQPADDHEAEAETQAGATEAPAPPPQRAEPPRSEPDTKRAEDAGSAEEPTPPETPGSGAAQPTEQGQPEDKPSSAGSKRSSAGDESYSDDVEEEYSEDDDFDEDGDSAGSRLSSAPRPAIGLAAAPQVDLGRVRSETEMSGASRTQTSRSSRSGSSRASGSRTDTSRSSRSGTSRASRTETSRAASASRGETSRNSRAVTSAAARATEDHITALEQQVLELSGQLEEPSDAASSEAPSAPRPQSEQAGHEESQASAPPAQPAQGCESQVGRLNTKQAERLGATLAAEATTPLAQRDLGERLSTKDMASLSANSDAEASTTPVQSEQERETEMDRNSSKEMDRNSTKQCASVSATSDEETFDSAALLAHLNVAETERNSTKQVASVSAVEQEATPPALVVDPLIRMASTVGEDAPASQAAAPPAAARESSKAAEQEEPAGAGAAPAAEAERAPPGDPAPEPEQTPRPSAQRYRVVSAGPLQELPVSADASRSSATIAHLAILMEVEVVEISDKLDGGRRRARILSPAGWITIENTKTGTVFAELVPEPPREEEPEPSQEPYAAVAAPEQGSAAQPAEEAYAAVAVFQQSSAARPADVSQAPVVTAAPQDRLASQPVVAVQAEGSGPTGKNTEATASQEQEPEPAPSAAAAEAQVVAAAAAPKECDDEDFKDDSKASAGGAAAGGEEAAGSSQVLRQTSFVASEVEASTVVSARPTALAEAAEEPPAQAPQGGGAADDAPVAEAEDGAGATAVDAAAAAEEDGVVAEAEEGASAGVDVAVAPATEEEEGGDVEEAEDGAGATAVDAAAAAEDDGVVAEAEEGASEGVDVGVAPATAEEEGAAVEEAAHSAATDRSAEQQAEDTEMEPATPLGLEDLAPQAVNLVIEESDPGDDLVSRRMAFENDGLSVLGNRKNPADAKRREVDHFLHLMREKGNGNTTLAWRRYFDSDGDGNLSFSEFCGALAMFGYRRDALELWQELAGSDSQVSLEVVDKGGAQICNYFADWCEKVKGGPFELFKEIDVDESLSVTPEEFVRGVRRLGLFEEEDLIPQLSTDELVLKNLYPLLDVNAGGLVMCEHMLFLEKNKKKVGQIRKELRRIRELGIDAAPEPLVSQATSMLNDLAKGRGVHEYEGPAMSKVLTSSSSFISGPSRRSSLLALRRRSSNPPLREGTVRSSVAYPPPSAKQGMGSARAVSLPRLSEQRTMSASRSDGGLRAAKEVVPFVPATPERVKEQRRKKAYNQSLLPVLMPAAHPPAFKPRKGAVWQQDGRPAGFRGQRVADFLDPMKHRGLMEHYMMGHVL